MYILPSKQSTWHKHDQTHIPDTSSRPQWANMHTSHASTLSATSGCSQYGQNTHTSQLSITSSHLQCGDTDINISYLNVTYGHP